MSSCYPVQRTKSVLTSEIAAELELKLYCLQCEENYQLDIKKMIFNDNTIIILGAFDNDLFRKKVQNKQKLNLRQKII